MLLLKAILLAATGVSSISHANPCADYGVQDRTQAIRAEDLDLYVLINYRQKGYLLQDPVGDYALASHAELTPKKIFWDLIGARNELERFQSRMTAAEPCATWLFGLEGAYRSDNPPPLQWKAPQAEIDVIQGLQISDTAKTRLLKELLEGRLVLESGSNPLNEGGFKKMFARVIQEEAARGILPTEGKHHTWSPEFLDDHRSRFFPYTQMPKILVALARGEAARYLLTGKEDTLRAYILSQPEGSIEIDELFRQSYRIHGGDVYLSLLTIETVLSRDWLVPNRQNLATTRRLSKIVQHFGNKEDRFGSWYHLFGIMLYGYVKGSLEATVIGNIEGLGSLILDAGHPDAQENLINHHGAEIGSSLRHLVKSGEWKTLPTKAMDLRASRYLNQNSSFASRLIEMGERGLNP